MCEDAARTFHLRRDAHIASSTPVNALTEVPSASPIPPTTSICHSSIGAPRSQRFQDSLRRRRAPGSISPARFNAGPRWAPGRSGGAPAPPRSAADPTPGAAAAAPAPPPPPPATCDADTTQDDAKDRPTPPARRPSTSQSGMQRRPQHTPLLGNQTHRMALGDHRQHRQIAPLRHAQLPHRGSVKDQPKQLATINRSAVALHPKPRGQASGEATQSQKVGRVGLEPTTQGL